MNFERVNFEVTAEAPQKPEVKKARDKTPEEVIELRFRQSSASRLCEYLTGIRPDDSKMAERMLEDQSVIRGKYQLPPRWKMRLSPAEYEKLLRDRAQSIGVAILEGACDKYLEEFFRTYSYAGGVYSEEQKKIGVAINKESLDDYLKSLSVLEHEFIHAEQHHQSPRMPIELMEYEAYIAGQNAAYLKEHPEVVETIFSFLIGGSVRHWYRQKNKDRAKDEPEVTPIWHNPEYFLKNIDKIDPQIIEAYKRKHATSDDRGASSP